MWLSLWCDPCLLKLAPGLGLRTAVLPVSLSCYCRVDVSSPLSLEPDALDVPSGSAPVRAAEVWRES